MPNCIQPSIRALEEAMEAAHILHALDSQGVTVKKAQEADSSHPKELPTVLGYFINGTDYVPS